MNKKRLSTIFAVAVGTDLLSSVAYAAKKKIQTKYLPKPRDISEADLAAGLTSTKEAPKQKVPHAAEIKSDNDEKFREVMDKIASK